MFAKLTDFSYKRCVKEAVGFYIAYLVMLLIITIILIILTILITGQEGQHTSNLAIRIGAISAMISCIVISFIILYKKKLTNNFILIFVALLSCVLAYFGGALLGLIPVAYLSTRKESIPPPLPQRKELEATDYPLAKAWPRFFARTFDMWWEALLIGYVAGYVLALSNPDFILWIKNPGSEFIFGMLLVPIFLFFDAALYSIAGNTPGKMLLGLKVTTLSGRTLEFIEYLMRNMSVWLSGLALGFPLVYLFTMYNQHKRLGRGEQASYDDGPGYRVHAKPLGGLRIAVFSLLFFCIFIVMSVLKTKYTKG